MTDKQRALSGEFLPDAERYAACSQPHESLEALNGSVAEFYEDLAALRLKHRLRNLYVIYAANVQEGGRVQEVVGTAGQGNVTEWEGLVALALGREQVAREKRVADMVQSGRSR